jgi:hypothetical protein
MGAYSAFLLADREVMWPSPQAGRRTAADVFLMNLFIFLSWALVVTDPALRYLCAGLSW